METQERPTEYPVTFLGIDRPSKALRAMLTGLIKASERPTFVIEMSVFSEYIKDKDICYGCAATCALMELTGDDRIVKSAFMSTGDSEINITPGRYLSNKFSTEDHDDIRATFFESAIDEVRKGDPGSLFRFFHMHDFVNRDSDGYAITLGWYLDSFNWKDHIGQIEATITEWESRGL